MLKLDSKEQLIRIILGVEYDGTLFSGWQRQPGRRTIQAELEAAVSIVADESIAISSAGRTDAGVHAIEQIVQFDTLARRDVNAWVMGVNSNLPGDIRVLWAKQPPIEFHARYSAIARYYRYVILNRPTNSALLRSRVAWCYTPLEPQRMTEAARYILGEHDFTSFRAKNCQSKSPFRRMYHINVDAREEFVVIDLVANAFLHHMVRNIAGVLIEIGSGKNPPNWAREVLIARNRACAGITAKASGLYLVAVKYPAEFSMTGHSIFDCLPDCAERFD